MGVIFNKLSTRGLPLLSKTEYKSIWVLTLGAEFPCRKRFPCQVSTTQNMAKDQDMQFYLSFSKISTQRDQNG